MPTGRVRWDLRETEKGKEGLEKDPGGTMPKVTRKNAVRRATKRHTGSLRPPLRRSPSIFFATLSYRRQIYEREFTVLPNIMLCCDLRELKCDRTL